MNQTNADQKMKELLDALPADLGDATQRYLESSGGAVSDGATKPHVWFYVFSSSVTAVLTLLIVPPLLTLFAGILERNRFTTKAQINDTLPQEPAE